MIDSVRPYVRLSVTVRYHVKTTPATIMRSSLEDSPMTLVRQDMDQIIFNVDTATVVSKSS